MLLSLLAVVLTNSACSIIDAEQHYRGGFTNKLVDDRLVKADSKSMRVLRAAAILGLLSQAATTNLQGTDNATAALNQMRATAYDIGVAFQVASTTTNNNDSPSCTVISDDKVLQGHCYDPTFDLHMKLVVDDLIRTAGLSLPTTDLKRLVGAIESGDYVSVLASLFKGLIQVVDTTRTAFAGYRDLVDANGAIVLRKIGSDPSVPFVAAYKSGEGDFATYAPALDTYLATDRTTVVTAVQSDFVPWFRLIKFTCMRASWYKLYTNATFQTLAKNTSAGSCDLPADGFATALADYQAGFPKRD